LLSFKANSKGRLQCVLAFTRFAIMMDSKDGPPSAKAIDEGYNQTYLIMNNDKAHEEAKTEDNHEVFFRCGNWCYKGQIQFGGLALGTEQRPVLIPLLQKQQGSMRYYCNAKR
jgi:hypothetical protein